MGITMSLVYDCIIAASAQDHGFVLVTDNRKGLRPDPAGTSAGVRAALAGIPVALIGSAAPIECGEH